MTTSEERVRELITQQAADWFVANRGGLSPQEQGEFTSWLQASPAHVEEYLAVAVIARDLREACSGLAAQGADAAQAPDLPATWVRETPAVRTRTAWGMRAAAAFALAALAAGGLWILRPGPAPGPVAAPAWSAEFATGHGQLRRVELPDGSVVTLNGDSYLRARFTATQRTLSLAAGEADFKVVHESARDFRVAAGSVV